MLVEVVLVLVLLVFLYRTFSKPKGLPPGVWGLPLVGTLLGHSTSLPAYFHKLQNKFGDVFTVRLGSRVVVVVSDYQLIKAAFNNPALQGRPDFFTFKIFSFFDNLGLVFSSGQVWQNGRRFALQHLKEFGMGKSKLEGTIEREVSVLLDHFSNTEGKPNELGRNLNVAILNVIWSLVAAPDRRYDINDEEMIYFANLMKVNFGEIQGPIVLLDHMPWLIPLIPQVIKDKWMDVDKVIRDTNTVFVFLKKVIEDHRKTLDPSHPWDYIDAYMIEAEAQKDNPDSTFRLDYKDLLTSVRNLFVAGSETTSATLRWVFLFMALYPDVQKKVQDEIDSVVPRDSLPTLEHKTILPYLQATICEVQRRASVVPLGMFHMATEDTTLAGYYIPKGTLVGAYQESCHYNKKYFERPHDFYPEHFLEAQGKFISKKEGFLPFSIGRRQCLGESLAKMELYLFTAAILHRFTITPRPGVTLTTEADKTKTLVNFTLPFSVIFTKRPTT